MTDVEYSSGPDKVPLHFYVSQYSTTHNNYQRKYEREKAKCSCGKLYHEDEGKSDTCKKNDDHLGFIEAIFKNAPNDEIKTGFSENKNPYVVYDKNIDENDNFRDDFHWLSTYNDIYKNPKYKDRGNNIYTIVEDSYTRGIKQIWDPSLHEKDDDISVMKKDYRPKTSERNIRSNDQVYDTNSGYCINSDKVHNYKGLAKFEDDGHYDIYKDKKIDWYYNRNVFPSYIEDDGFTRNGSVYGNLNLVPKYEETKKKNYISFPNINNTQEKKPFEQYKTITHSDYNFKPINVIERLKMKADSSVANNSKLYSGTTYYSTPSNPKIFITETMDKYRDNKESKKVEEELKHPIKCDYMYDNGYTKGNRNSKNFIEMSDIFKSSETLSQDQLQSRLYLKRHRIDISKAQDSLPINPQNTQPDRQLIDYLNMTKTSPTKK
ncbi:hypothetical protein LY90DRAFT_213708 [Neocallimastix californiae]|jgi:hypothetical protein|uniref:Uncharacterized protein n=1 Tax=Neocallimastix californiae TaxID=1754190 RepID=A0A1Y2E9S8_9FUNG|nr:hypothetical protein LY90DRAFT_213708 [Neocallimastix californiae]|eukprot:ORY68157.1 hypothetical protein LY90DRAFT_213708 [Neocallimastix californiae]